MEQQPHNNIQEDFQEIMSNLKVNPENAINSLSDRNAKLDKENAQKDAVINALIEQMIELKKDNKNLREALKENERGVRMVSNNGNTKWDLGSGKLEMKDTNFTGFVYNIGTENSRFRFIITDKDE